MIQRFAAIIALIAFAICLLQGLAADNTFATTVRRAMLAMAGSFVIGLVIGYMGQLMLHDTPNTNTQKLENSATKLNSSDR